MKLLKDESGQVVALTLVSASLLLAFLALAVDIGMLFRARRNLQIVADAAATAGALDYYKNASTSSAIAAAQNAVTANGLTSATFNCPVAVSGSTPDACVSSPASSGVHTGTGTVEVDIINPNPTVLLSYFGFNPMNVYVRAVAGSNAAQGCIHINNTFSVQGSSQLFGAMGGTLGTCSSGPQACGIYVGQQVSVTGNSNCVNARYVETPGSLTGNHNLHPSPVATGVPAQTPPAPLTASPPAPTSSCSIPNGTPTTRIRGSTYYVLSGSLSAGCYGVPSGSTSSVNISLGGNTTSLSSGVYVFNLGTNGTLVLDSNVSGGSSAQDSPGVTLDLYSGSFSVTSTTSDQLYAPSDGSTGTGILLWEPSSNTGTINIQWGSSSGAFYGYIVAPGATVTMQHQVGDALVTGLYVNNLTMGPSTLYIENYSALYPNAPMNTVSLDE